MVCIIVGMETVRAQETQEALSQAHDSLRVRTVYVHDTIYIERPAVEAAQPDSSEIIYTKPVGRFDRGIINYRFIPKKKWVGGLTFSYIKDSYSIALFHRSYVGLDRGKRFGFFNESSLSYNNGSSTFTRGKDEALKRTETTIHEIHLGLNPGVAVFIMENVCAEMSFGVVGFKYRIEKQKNNEGETGKRTASGADFKINLFNINIGITLCL